MASGATTPYITPAVLLASPNGIAWKSLPGGANNQPSAAQNFAELTNICWRATSEVETHIGQQLRALLHTEQQYAPDFWVTLPNGPFNPARMYTRRWPVLKIIGGQISAASAFPRVWTQLLPTQFDVDYSIHGETTGISQAPDTGISPTPISIAPGIINWQNGRRGKVLNVSYVAGWPQAGIVSGATAGASSFLVDDVTGYDTAADPTPIVSMIYDDDFTEQVRIASAVATTPVITASGFSVNSGPGTITLQSGTSLQYNHTRMSATNQTLMSTLPETVIQATILYACSIAVVRGATASTIQQSPGQGSRAGSTSANFFRTEAEALLRHYRHMV